MYVRQFKHFMKTFDETFDERRYGFAGILDALRFGQREGLFRLDRDRQGGVRVHPGAQYQQLTQSPRRRPPPTFPSPARARRMAALRSTPRPVPLPDALTAPDRSAAVPEPVPVEADATTLDQTAEAAPLASSGEPAPGDEAAAEPAPAPRAATRKRAAAGPRTATRAKKAAAPAAGTKKKAARPRAKKA